MQKYLKLIKINLKYILYILDFIFISLFILYILDKLGQLHHLYLSQNLNPSIFDQALKITNINTVSIFHNNSEWSNGILNLFIYGTGVFRLQLTRSGTPGSRVFIIASTLAADNISKVLTNTINEPTYVQSHIANWEKIWDSKTSAESGVMLEVGDSTAKRLSEALPPVMESDKGAEAASNFISSQDFGDLTDKIVNGIFGLLKGVLEPVTVSYSNELLLDQVYGISILLFILSLLIIILFSGFLLNIIIFLYTDRILKYFTNKYIRLYIELNKKFIGIEIFFLSASILYFLCVLSTGLHFLCTHPIQLI